jgi:hypothetical protein
VLLLQQSLLDGKLLQKQVFLWLCFRTRRKMADWKKKRGISSSHK